MNEVRVCHLAHCDEPVRDRGAYTTCMLQRHRKVLQPPYATRQQNISFLSTTSPHQWLLQIQRMLRSAQARLLSVWRPNTAQPSATPPLRLLTNRLQIVPSSFRERRCGTEACLSPSHLLNRGLCMTHLMPTSTECLLPSRDECDSLPMTVELACSGVPCACVRA